MLLLLRRDCLVLSVVLLCVPACNSNQEDVCENVADCAQGGDSDSIKRCKDEGKLLQHEAGSANCIGFFDDYYACANSNFTCQGATPSFPGCDAKRAALESCLTNTQARTACGELVTKTGACESSAAIDAGADASIAVGGGSSLPSSCTVARDCRSRCYIDNVANVCAPAADDLSRFTDCATSCPP